jgi:hypothetical protein
MMVNMNIIQEHLSKQEMKTDRRRRRRRRKMIDT